MVSGFDSPRSQRRYVQSKEETLFGYFLMHISSRRTLEERNGHDGEQAELTCGRRIAKSQARATLRYEPCDSACCVFW